LKSVTLLHAPPAKLQRKILLNILSFFLVQSRDETETQQNRETLVAACFVSQTWNFAARSLLIKNQRACDRSIDQWICGVCLLNINIYNPAVECLDLVLTGVYQEYCNIVASLVTRISSLSLRFRSRDWGYYSALCEFLSNCPELKRLLLENFDFGSKNPQEFPAALNIGFSRLVYLEINLCGILPRLYDKLPSQISKHSYSNRQDILVIPSLFSHFWRFMVDLSQASKF
jgi:hypothetical protein